MAQPHNPERFASVGVGIGMGLFSMGFPVASGPSEVGGELRDVPAHSVTRGNPSVPNDSITYFYAFVPLKPPFELRKFHPGAICFSWSRTRNDGSTGCALKAVGLVQLNEFLADIEFVRAGM